jgi:hypothetical protein
MIGWSWDHQLQGEVVVVVVVDVDDEVLQEWKRDLPQR